MSSTQRSSGPRLLHIGTFLQRHVSDPLRSKGFKQNGWEVADFDYRSKASERGKPEMWNMLLHVIGTWHPQIILINKGELIDPNIIRSAKMQFPRMMVAMFFGDQRGYAVREIADLASVCDVLLINNDDAVQMECYRKLGIREVMTWHTASDTDIYRPMPPNGYECDVAFMGGNYSVFPDSELRGKLIGMVSSHFNAKIYGGGWPAGFGPTKYVFGEDFARAVAGAKVILGINAYNDVHQYTSNRTWNTLACGTSVYLTYPFAGMEDLFEVGKHLLIFKSPEDAIARINHLLSAKNALVREQIAAAGRDLILSKHTYKHRAAELLAFYEDWKRRIDERLRQGIGPYEAEEGSKNII